MPISRGGNLRSSRGSSSWVRSLHPPHPQNPCMHAATKVLRVCLRGALCLTRVRSLTPATLTYPPNPRLPGTAGHGKNRSDVVREGTSMDQTTLDQAAGEVDQAEQERAATVMATPGVVPAGRGPHHDDCAQMRLFPSSDLINGRTLHSRPHSRPHSHSRSRPRPPKEYGIYHRHPRFILSFFLYSCRRRCRYEIGYEA